MTGTQRNHIDLALLFAVLSLMLLSLGVVYSASSTWAFHKFGESEKLLNSHILKVAIGIGALFVGILIPYQRYKKVTKPLLFLAILLLGVTLITGGEVKGATRWLRVGGMGFQSSEFAKFALLFHLSALLAIKGDAVREFKRGFLPMIIWAGAVTVLVLLQPNFSTASIIMVVTFVMLFVGRVRWMHMISAATIIAVAMAIVVMLSPYKMERIQSYLSGEESAGKSLYQMQQGVIGFGNGGLIGVGPGESRQRDLFLPESYGDFAFAIVGEEYGFVGTMVFLSLFLIILIRGVKIARATDNPFGFFLSTGIIGMIVIYALVNAAVTLGLLPTTGLPMPFVSYGGSSIVFSGFAVGVVLNVSSYTDLHPRIQKIPVVGTVDASGEVSPQSPPVVGRVYS